MELRGRAHLFSRRPVGWLSKKDMGKCMTLASRFLCNFLLALKLPSTSSRDLMICKSSEVGVNQHACMCLPEAVSRVVPVQHVKVGLDCAGEVLAPTVFGNFVESRCSEH